MSSKKTKKSVSSRRKLRQRTKELRQAINSMAFVSSGTLHTRTKVCGRKNCRCATDPDARHGPYHEWNRREQGRLVHHIVTPQQAKLVERAIRNLREIQRLLAEWERQTVAEILNRDPADLYEVHEKKDK